MRFLDLFAGIGGFRLALEREGYTCAGFCEIDKFARQTYKANFDTKGEVEWHDIGKVKDKTIRDIGNIDIITAGFPCQAFSVAGKRGGFEDTRGTLFFEIARFARILRPKYLLLENVKGLLSHGGGYTFATILDVLGELGYFVEWQILNSKNFGVPQNRERVFIVGHLGGEPRRKVFPIEGANGKAIKQVIGGSQGYRVYDPNGTSVTIASQAGGVGARTGLYAIPVMTPDRLEKRQNGRRFKEDGEPMFTLTAQDRHGVLIKHKPEVRAVALQNANMQGRRIKEKGEPMFTLTAQDRHGVLINRGKVKVKEDNLSNCLDANYYKGLDNHGARTGVLEKPAHIPGPNDINNTVRSSGRASLTPKHNHDNIYDGVRIRRLTPLECFRLQGFPDEHHHRGKKAGVSDSQLYKQAGNAVTVNVVQVIARRLREVEIDDAI